VGDEAGWVLEEGVTDLFGVVEEVEGVDFDGGTHVVALGYYEWWCRFDELLSSPIELCAQVQHSPLKLVVMLILCVDF
jgi:hypothetical protein